MDYVATFSSFAVDDLATAKTFYSETLSVEIASEAMGLHLALSGGGRVHVYERKDYRPADFTVLNFIVANIDAAVADLVSHGVVMERYDSLPASQDERGILRGLSTNMGPDIAWFKDPAGNILSVLQEQ